MGLGIYALVDSDSLKDFIHIIDSDLDVNLFGLAGGLIVGVSLIIAAIAFFGCCGAVKVRICFGIILHFSHFLAVSTGEPLSARNLHADPSRPFRR